MRRRRRAAPRLAVLQLLAAVKRSAPCAIWRRVVAAQVPPGSRTAAEQPLSSSRFYNASSRRSERRLPPLLPDPKLQQLVTQPPAASLALVLEPGLSLRSLPGELPLPWLAELPATDAAPPNESLARAPVALSLLLPPRARGPRRACRRRRRRRRSPRRRRRRRRRRPPRHPPRRRRRAAAAATAAASPYDVVAPPPAATTTAAPVTPPPPPPSPPPLPPPLPPRLPPPLRVELPAAVEPRCWRRCGRPPDAAGAAAAPLDYNAAVRAARRRSTGGLVRIAGPQRRGVLGAAAECPRYCRRRGARARRPPPRGRCRLARRRRLARQRPAGRAAAGRAADVQVSGGGRRPPATPSLDDVPQFAPAVAFPGSSPSLGHVAANGGARSPPPRRARAHLAACSRRLRRPTLPTITPMC